MTQEIEIEFKNLLTAEEYNKLHVSLPFPETGISQTNHYFETPDFSIKDHGAALRIREKNGHFVLTLKEPHEEGLLETHAELTEEEAKAWLDGKPVMKDNIHTQLEQLSVPTDRLHHFGSLTTLRMEAESRGVLLVLDYSTYNGKDDYEFELEAADYEHGEKVFNEILAEFSIQKRETPNKIQRFFKTLGEERL